MSSKTKKILVSIGMVVLMATFFVSGFFTHKAIFKPVERIKIDTTYIHTIDTVKVREIAYKWAIRTDTVYIPQDTILYLEQKCYEDTFSTIWISGIEPEIDSIEYRIPKDTVLIEKERTVIMPEKKVRLGQSVTIGLQTGIGYGFGSNRFEPYIGVGISYGFGINWKK